LLSTSDMPVGSELVIILEVQSTKTGAKLIVMAMSDEGAELKTLILNVTVLSCEASIIIYCIQPKMPVHMIKPSN